MTPDLLTPDRDRRGDDLLARIAELEAGVPAAHPKATGTLPLLLAARDEAVAWKRLALAGLMRQPLASGSRFDWCVWAVGEWKRNSRAGGCPVMARSWGIATAALTPADRDTLERLAAELGVTLPEGS